MVCSFKQAKRIIAGPSANSIGSEETIRHWIIDQLTPVRNRSMPVNRGMPLQTPVSIWWAHPVR